MSGTLVADAVQYRAVGGEHIAVPDGLRERVGARGDGAHAGHARHYCAALPLAQRPPLAPPVSWVLFFAGVVYM